MPGRLSRQYGAHLLLRTGAAPLSTVMARLLTGYATSYNLRHRRSGHLFQNRYKSIICQEEPYVTGMPLAGPILCPLRLRRHRTIPPFCRTGRYPGPPDRPCRRRTRPEQRGVEARSLYCFWAARELGVSQKDLALRFCLTEAAISYAVTRGQRIACERGYALRYDDG